MRFAILGVIREGKKVVAYKIYDIENKICEVKSQEFVYTTIKKCHSRNIQIEVIGLKLLYNGNFKNISNNNFSFNKIEELDGFEEPIGSTRIWTILSYSGFANAKKYRLVDCYATEKIVNKEELLRMIENNEINGGRISEVSGEPILYSQCNYREESYS